MKARGGRAGGASAAMGALALCAAMGSPAEAARAEAARADLRERVIELRAADGSALVTTVFSPPGEGPFPLVVMSHGKSGGDPRLEPRARYVALSREFVQKGYAVALPMRRGFGGSGGAYASAGCDMEKDALRQASDIRSALDGLTRLSWVRKGELIVAGQSYGGLASLALGAQGYPGLRATLNFAGGLKDERCDWRSGVEAALARFGASATAPSLWFYGANDSLFEPALARRWLGAYNAESARKGAAPGARLVAFGAFKADAHELAGSWRGPEVWGPPVDGLLAQVGLPTEKTNPLPEGAESREGPGQEAALAERGDSLGSESAKAGYRAFLRKPYPRAFAVSAQGAWSWSEDGDDPAAQALRACAARARGPCSLYAVDGWAVSRGSDPALRASQKGERAEEPARGGSGGGSASSPP